MSGTPDNTKRVNGDAVMAITDEEIMRYADGVLAVERRAVVRDGLARDPALMQTLEGFLQTRGPLTRPFDDILAAPIPARVQSVLQSPAAAVRPRRRLFDRLQSAMRRQAPARSRMPMLAVAAFCGMLLGAWLVGFVIRPAVPATDGYEFVKLGKLGMTASAALRRALDQTPTGEQADISEQLSITPIATLHTQDHSWCREFDLVSRDGLRDRSLACRASDGQWLVPVTSPFADKLYGVAAGARPEASPNAPEHKSAHKTPAIVEGAKQRIVSEGAVTAAKEKALIKGHWRERD